MIESTQRTIAPEQLGNRIIPVEDDYYFEPVELHDGDRVRHRSFGEGVVIGVLRSYMN